MEIVTNHPKQHAKGASEPLIQKSPSRVMDFCGLGDDRTCHLVSSGEKGTYMIAKQGDWYVLTGSVDGQHTKRELFALIPKHNGLQMIVDQLRID